MSQKKIEEGKLDQQLYSLHKCERIKGKFSKQHFTVVRENAKLTEEYAKHYNQGFSTSGMLFVKKTEEKK